MLLMSTSGETQLRTERYKSNYLTQGHHATLCANLVNLKEKLSQLSSI